MTTITIRQVPDEARNEVASRAARSGRSLQEYKLGEVTRLASMPSVEDLMDEVREHKRKDRQPCVGRVHSGSPARRAQLTHVVDASAVVAALAELGPNGQ